MTRGRAVESAHHGVAAVVAPDGSLVARCGDPGYEVVARSSVKPFQLLPLLLSGGADAFGLDAGDLALACASHSGTPEQAERVRAMLARAGLGPERLGCGAHRPFDPRAAEALDRAGTAPTPLHNNCSGKHAAMLLASVHGRLSLDGYLDPAHPHQRRIAEELAACSGSREPAVAVAGIDGCSAPTFALPVRSLARAFAALAAPEATALAPERAAALARAAEAMAARPDLVAGPGRFTSALIAVTGGRVLGKEGAEGVYGLAIRGPHALGAAIKIADGGERARDTVVLELLLQLGALSGEESRALEPFFRPLLTNHRGVEIGEILPELELVET